MVGSRRGRLAPRDFRISASACSDGRADRHAHGIIRADGGRKRATFFWPALLAGFEVSDTPSVRWKCLLYRGKICCLVQRVLDSGSKRLSFGSEDNGVFDLKPEQVGALNPDFAVVHRKS